MANPENGENKTEGGPGGAPADKPAVKPSSALRANRNYVRLWTGSAISGLGSQLSVLAYPLLVLALHGGAARAGAVGTCSLVARMVFRAPGGHLTDRADWRWLMVRMDLIRLLAVGSVPLAAGLGWLTFPQLLVVAVVEGTATAFFRPAGTVALRDVVPKEQLRAAFSLGQSRSATIDLLGPMVGGALFGLMHELPFIIDASTYAVSAVLLLSLRVTPRERTAPKGDKRVSAGLRWLLGQPEVVRVLLFTSLLNVVATAAEVGVVITLNQRGTKSAVIGTVLACAGVGGIVGSLLAPRILGWAKDHWLFIVVGGVWAAGLAGFALDPAPQVIAPLLVLLLMVTPVVGIRLGETTLGQAPRELIGRISTAEETVTTGLASAGPFLAGLAIGGLGASAAWSGMAVLCAVAGIAGAVPLSRFARRPAKPVPESVPVPDTAG